ncbi:MAG: DNA polymerase III subunit beta, partial [Planctomycetota bacterium]
MKIACERENLLQAFQTVAAVAPARSPKPILQNVRIDAAEQGVTLTATDLEIGVRHGVEGMEIKSPGSALLSVSQFGSILRESADQTLRLESDGQRTTVRGDRSLFQLPAASVAEFPSVAAFDGDSYFEVPARLLRELVRRTAFATDSESSRFALGGVKLEFENDQITAVGTDGRRLARMSGPVAIHGEPNTVSQNVIVPTRAMLLIERAVAPSDAEVKVSIRGNEFLVQSQRAMVAARLLEGRFPEWRKVFPDAGGSTRIDLAVGPTHAAVRQAAIVTSEESRGVDFSFGDGMLLLSGRSAEVGESRVELPIGYDGEPIVITLDPRYVVEFLKVLDADKTFQVALIDSESAAVCSKDDGFGYVIMPLA